MESRTGRNNQREWPHIHLTCAPSPLSPPSLPMFMHIQVHMYIHRTCSTSAPGKDANTEHTKTLPAPLANLINAPGYNSKGERLVAGVVPLTSDKQYVLLIQSTRRKGWVLPKGGWETDEECTEAAAREAWEEAGISIQIDYDLGEIVETRPPKKAAKDKALYRFYEATVLVESEDWPERHKRERRWMTFAQAKEALAARPELLDALNRSTMRR